MLTFSVQSGSNGNCIYVEAGNTRLLFDAGVSAKTLQARMAEHGRSPDDVDGLIISHEHIDHVRGAGVFQRKFGMPIFFTRATHAAVRCNLGGLTDVRYFHAGEALVIGDITVRTVSTPHDAVDSTVFVVQHENSHLGIFTDLGHAFAGLDELLGSVDAAYLESNYDVDMLARGPYSDALKRRIAGSGGHVSNVESAELVRRSAAKRHKWIALSHLSEQNNAPELALETHRRHAGSYFPYDVSSRNAVSPMRCV